MNVLHLDEQTGWRGGELQASWIIRGLMERGHFVAVAGKPDSAFLTADYGGDVVRIPAPFRTEIDIRTARMLAKAIQEYQIDILHAQTSHAHMMACLARRFAGRGKVVVSRRVSFPPKRNPLNRWKYRMPERFIAVSDYVARVLLDYGIAPSKVTVVHSSIDLSRLDVKPVSRADLGVPRDVPLVGSIGAIVGHKDHRNLVDAFALALKELPDLHLVIAGDGDLRPALEERIAELGLVDRVHLLGHRTDAPAVMRALDLYVSSSWSEGLGTSVLEALACRVPVVATEAGGVGEMVRHERTGLLYPARNPEALAEGMVRMLREESLGLRLAENGEAHVHLNFTVDKMVAGNIRVYEEMLAEG